jgi:CheY-like chemotaxis protein
MAIILIVDDEPTISAMVAELVEDHGHKALRARHGAEALELAREHMPALIISDVMMPVMNGYALLASVRMTPELQNTPVYLMSAAMTNYLGRYIEIQPDGFIPKPLDFSTLEAVLDRLRGA